MEEGEEESRRGGVGIGVAIRADRLSLGRRDTTLYSIYPRIIHGHEV